jgi:hypothetical protein
MRGLRNGFRIVSNGGPWQLIVSNLWVMRLVLYSELAIISIDSNHRLLCSGNVFNPCGTILPLCRYVGIVLLNTCSYLFKNFWPRALFVLYLRFIVPVIYLLIPDTSRISLLVKAFMFFLGRTSILHDFLSRSSLTSELIGWHSHFLCCKASRCGCLCVFIVLKSLSAI